MSDSISFTLYLVNWIHGHSTIAELPPSTINELYHRWKTEILPAVDDKHKGECIDIPMTCRKCQIDEILENAAAISTVISKYNIEDK